MTNGVEHELGGYRALRTSGALARIAEAVWVHRAGSAGMHRVLPDPAVNLAFRCRRSDDGRVCAPRLVIIGPKTRPFIFRFRAGDEIAAVKVKLEWVGCLLGLDPADHLDREDHLPSAGSLFQTLAGTRSAEEAAHAIALALLDRQRLTNRTAPSVASHALDLVRQATGRIRVEAVAQRMGVSLRHLHRAVHEATAVPLKAYARMTRFNFAMAAADRSPRPSWARIALESGFCDQSHLVRESRALAGLAPGPVFRERRAQADLSNPL